MSKASNQTNLMLSSQTASQVSLEQLETFGTRVERVTDFEGIYSLDALVEEKKDWLRMICFAIDEPDRERFLKNLEEFKRQREIWTSPRTTKVHFVGTRTWSPPATETEPRGIDWARDSSRILERLDPSFGDKSGRRMAVLLAETAAFDDSQRPQLLDRLCDFITENRFATDEDTLVSLGAAIRKFAMNMSESDFEAYAEWLRPTQTETLSHHVELELTKSVAWRLVYEKVDGKDTCPQLISSLSSLAVDYLTPRLILQENYASIALNAILAVFVLEATCGEEGETRELLKKVEELDIDWFSESALRRIDDAATAISSLSIAAAQRLRVLTDPDF